MRRELDECQVRVKVPLYTAMMQIKPSLATKLQVLGVVFLMVALASIGFTLWVTWKLEGGAAAVNEAGRLRMNLMRMVLAQQNESPEALSVLVRRFDDSLELLRTGDPSRPLFVPWSAETRQQYQATSEKWSALRRDWQERPDMPSAESMRRGDALARLVDGFVESIEKQISGWTAALHLFQLFMVALAIATAVAFIVLSYLLVLNPVTRLQQAISRMRQGDLSTRLEVQSSDEFGQLTAGFNLMAHALQVSHDDLENKVREKTASVGIQNQRLAALYQVSALAAEAGDLGELTRGFIQQIREVSECDATAIRWSDETNERYMMLASEGLPALMQEQEHCLIAGACECGQPQERARMRVIPIAPVVDLNDDGSVQLNNCREAGFATVVSIPIELQHRLLGEVNLFYRTSVDLDEGMRELYATMAHHLASSMESLRVTALEREAAIAEERSSLARELHDSIAQSLAFLKIQTQLLRNAVAKGDDEARARSVDELEAGVRECYADVRELLVHFRTRTNDEDIEDALQATLSKFKHQTGLATSLTMHGHGLPLAPDVQIQVLHILQEALSNVRKHAGAKRVDLRVLRHPHWRFEVHDDGRGFDPANVPPDSLHVGIGIMKERAQRIGASLRLSSHESGTGTSVTVELPSSFQGVSHPAA